MTCILSDNGIKYFYFRLNTEKPTPFGSCTGECPWKFLPGPVTSKACLKPAADNPVAEKCLLNIL
jgi:hypothetical protein